MADTGVLFEVLPWAGDASMFLPMIGIDRDPILRLSALLPADPDVVREAAEALRLSNAQRARLIEALPDGEAVVPSMGERAARAALYRLGRQTFRDRLMRSWAADTSQAEAAKSLLVMADGWTRPAFPISGADLKAAGMSPSPAMGRILSELEAWWVAQDFPDVGLEGRLAALIAREGT
jgi:poly(A) polymerase